VVSADAKPPPADAGKIAISLLPAKVYAMARLDGIANHAAGVRITRMATVDWGLESVGLDPLTDFSAAIVASSGLSNQDSYVVVARTNPPTERRKSAVDTMIARSQPTGRWLDGTSVPTARVLLRSEEQVVVLAEPDLLVVMSGNLVGKADAFAGPLVLPPHEGPPTIAVRIDDPSNTLRDLGAFPIQIPTTLSWVVLGVDLRPDGGADIQIESQSASPEQANADAATLTQAVDDATSVKVSIVRVRMFRPVVFRAEGDRVKTNVTLSAAEVDMLLSFAEAQWPRQR